VVHATFGLDRTEDSCKICYSVQTEHDQQFCSAFNATKSLDISLTWFEHLNSDRRRVVPDALVNFTKLSWADLPDQLQWSLRYFPLIFCIVRQTDRIWLLNLQQTVSSLSPQTPSLWWAAEDSQLENHLAPGKGSDASKEKLLRLEKSSFQHSDVHPITATDTISALTRRGPFRCKDLDR